MTSNIIVAKRRKREQKTNYKKRLKLLISGKSRLVVRLSNNNITAQIVDYSEKGDKIVASAHSAELKRLGWKFSTGNIPAAYLVGMLVAKKAKEKGVKEAILDIGMKKPVKGSRVFACLKGAVDNGLKIPYSKEMLPNNDRTGGKHIKKEGIDKSFNDIKEKTKVKG